MNLELYLSAFIVGLLGAGHCLGMCGGISAALTFSIDKRQLNKRIYLILSYNIGRIACYALIGALAAGFGLLAEELGFRYMRIVAGVMIILMACSLSGVWKILSVLETFGQKIWVHIQPLGNRIMPVKNWYSAMMLGGLWGWLPCGLVYSAVALAATRANALEGAISMLCFGLGTLPAVVTGGMLADGLKKLLAGRWFRAAMAILMLCFGLWTLFMAGAHGQHSAHAGHAPASEQHMEHEHHHH